MLLYIHVPFCGSRCHYCAFYSQSLQKIKQPSLIIEAYLKTLLQELSFWKAHVETQPITSIFFGGGTPSVLRPQDVQLILNDIAKLYPLKERLEITLEANPETVQTVARAKDYLAAGVNRFSLGFQSLDNKRLLELGRSHNAQKALRAYEILREARCDNINIDLIWGLPDQSLKQWLAALKKTLELKPNHLALYNLTIEPDTFFEKKNLALPQEDIQVQMYLQSLPLMESVGLKQYEISNFAQDGRQCAQNNGYWSRRDYLGFGPSATSTVSPYRWTNPADLSSWQQAVQKRKIPTKELLDASTQTKELLMLGLRTTSGVSFHAYKKETGRDFMDDFKELVEPIAKKKAMRIQDARVTLTPEGMLISNAILKSLFEKLATIEQAASIR